MKNSFLLLFYLGLSCSQGVVGEDELLVKKGIFPYMAFIYYSDPAVVDATGTRFVRSAVLIRPDWLVTSALGPSVIENNGFPQKTLLARVGAVTVDGNFTLNEDEDEQEREVIQIVRPYNHSATQWWKTDISLMKTLFPFNITPVVDFKGINTKRVFNDKTCIILVYAKRNANRSDDKALTQLFVEVMKPSLENCGSHFAGSTMTCATSSDENKDMVYDPNFCQGNSGGPLLCEGEVMGLQTYIDNNCKQPHLYQLLSAWDTFITCGIEDKCQEENCAEICDVTFKDPMKPEIITTKQHTDNLANTPSPTQLTTTTAVPEKIIPEGEIVTTTVLVATVVEVVAETTRNTEILTPTLSTTVSTSETTENIAPLPDERKKLVEEDGDERKASVEAQLEGKKIRSATERNMCLVQTVVFGLVLCLF